MPKPHTLERLPSLIFALLGGAVATVLMLSVLHLAPLAGLPAVPLPALIGGLFYTDAASARGLGLALLTAAGVLVIAPALCLGAWRWVPARGRSLSAALIRALAWAALLFVVIGLLLPLLGALHRGPASDPGNPGFFAVSLGIAGPIALLLVLTVYSLALALVVWMGQNLSPVDMVGWKGIGKQGGGDEPT